MKLFAKLHERLGDFWWYSVLLFAATHVVDGLNWINACGLDWVLVAMLSLQLVKAVCIFTPIVIRRGKKSGRAN